MAKQISFSLSPESIEAAQEELRKYRESIKNKTEILRNTVAERIREDVEYDFKNAVMDVDIQGNVGTPDIRDVYIDKHQTKGDSLRNSATTSVVAVGKDVVFIEFGAGVYYNGDVGTSRNPLNLENNLGFNIGEYGKKHGRHDTWGFYENDDPENLVITHGTPASMPFYNAELAIVYDIKNIARLVFGQND